MRFHFSFLMVSLVWGLAMSWYYISTVRWVGKEVPLHLPDGFPGVRPCNVLKGGNAISSCFPIGLDLNFCFPQQNTGIYFCIDSPVFLEDGVIDVCSRWLCDVFSTLSLSLFPLWRFYTIQTIRFWRDMLLQTVFRASDVDWTSSQLPEREGKEATSPSKVSNILDGVYAHKNQSRSYLNHLIIW